MFNVGDRIHYTPTDKYADMIYVQGNKMDDCITIKEKGNTELIITMSTLMSHLKNKNYELIKTVVLPDDLFTI